MRHMVRCMITNTIHAPHDVTAAPGGPDEDERRAHTTPRAPGACGRNGVGCRAPSVRRSSILAKVAVSRLLGMLHGALLPDESLLAHEAS